MPAWFVWHIYCARIAMLRTTPWQQYSTGSWVKKNAL
jgi:hypothetical protein